MGGRKTPYEENHKIENEIEYKLCSICKVWLPCDTEHFYKNKSSKKDGLNPYCKKCTSEKSKTYQKENPDRKKKYYTKWNKNNMGKIKESNKKRLEDGRFLDYQRRVKDKIKDYNAKYKEKAHTITKKQWEYCKEYFNNSCAYCGMTEEDHKLKNRQQLHKEHVIHEGRGDLKNCVPSCKHCNSKKHTFSFNNWYNTKNPIYSKERYERICKWIKTDVKKYLKEISIKV